LKTIIVIKIIDSRVNKKAANNHLIHNHLNNAMSL